MLSGKNKYLYIYVLLGYVLNPPVPLIAIVCIRNTCTCRQDISSRGTGGFKTFFSTEYSFTPKQIKLLRNV